MRDGDFEHIQSALRAAVKEPAGAPAELVERTARRCEAVLAGRSAETRLRTDGALTSEQVYTLAATGLIGQLALGRALPPTGGVPDMVRELAASERFRSRLTGTAQDALAALHTGRLLPEDAQQTRTAAAAPARGAALGL